ncbi:MAG: tRNA (N(6)-L-threonylcarbamoyladenosine(37)-C(2))-methylthiotransferase MtaB [Atopobiaceae bacterium]
MAEKNPVVAFINLGCRVNRVETDTIALALEEAGCRIGTPDEADAVVVNTCAVTGEAEAKTRHTLRHTMNLPKRPYVVATGCAASLFADELESLGDTIEVVPLKAEVPKAVLAKLPAVAPEPLPCGVDATTPTGRTRPGIKVQDGCDNRCTFCIVWKARGAGRSVPLAQVISEVEKTLAMGAKEVVLTGINLGQYHVEEDGRQLRLPELLEEILKQTAVGRIRLSSIEPPDVDDRLIDVMAKNSDRIAPFLHICLQSGSDAVLKRMGRKYDTALYAHAVKEAKSKIPHLALGCDLIVGFPGETDEEFEESLEFCRRMQFAKMHIFRYSKRPGTPAAKAPGQVDPHVMAERAKRMHALAAEMRSCEARRLVGEEELVLVQAKGRGVTGGLFEAAVDPAYPVDTLERMRIVSSDAKGQLVAERL